MKFFDKQGHRGCRGLMPENTIPAMLKALELGVTTLEMDAVITKDKKVILSHEPFFNHEITTKADGSYIPEAEEKTYNIYGMTYTDTQGYDVGLKPHPRFPQQQKLAAHKPLLMDVIDSVEMYCKAKGLPAPQYNIETKTLPQTDEVYHPAPKEFVDILMHTILSRNIIRRVIIQSFDFRTLQYLHQHFPNVKTAMLVEDTDRRSLAEQLTALTFKPTIYSPNSVLATKERIAQCHAKGILVIPWTVNTTQEIIQLKNNGADGIISDYPNLFSKIDMK